MGKKKPKEPLRQKAQKDNGRRPGEKGGGVQIGFGHLKSCPHGPFRLT